MLGRHSLVGVIIAFSLSESLLAIDTHKINAFGVTPWTSKIEVELRLWQGGFRFQSRKNTSRSVVRTVYVSTYSQVVLYHMGSRCLHLETPLIEVDGQTLQVNDTKASIINKLGNPDRAGTWSNCESLVYQDTNSGGALNVRLAKGKVVHFSFPFHH